MSDQNYADILNKSWDEIPEAKALPVGSYLLKGRNASYQPAKEAGKNPVVLFVYQAKEAMDDVNADELASLGENYSIEDNRIFHRFYIEGNPDWDNVRKHLVKHGVDLKGKTLEEGLKAFTGTEIIGYLDQNTFQSNATGAMVTQNVVKDFAVVE